MTPTAQKAIDELLALKYLTATTGTITARAQREILRRLQGEDMIEVALYLRHGAESGEQK
jgi:hypothetical protein